MRQTLLAVAIFAIINNCTTEKQTSPDEPETHNIYYVDQKTSTYQNGISDKLELTIKIEEIGEAISYKIKNKTRKVFKFLPDQSVIVNHYGESKQVWAGEGPIIEKQNKPIIIGPSSEVSGKLYIRADFVTESDLKSNSTLDTKNYWQVGTQWWILRHWVASDSDVQKERKGSITFAIDYGDGEAKYHTLSFTAKSTMKTITKR